jgi:hypothetical protein
MAEIANFSTSLIFTLHKRLSGYCVLRKLTFGLASEITENYSAPIDNTKPESFPPRLHAHFMGRYQAIAGKKRKQLS